jgi:hypothetical protein
MLLNPIFAHVVADPGLRRHNNRAIGPDLDARLDDVFMKVSLAVGYVARESEVGQGRQVDVVGAPDAAFQHTSAPNGSVV